MSTSVFHHVAPWPCGDTTMLPVMATSKKDFGHISTGLRRGPQRGPSLPGCIAGVLHVHAWWHKVSQGYGDGPGLSLQGHYMANGVFRATLQASPRCVHGRKADCELSSPARLGRWQPI